MYGAAISEDTEAMLSKQPNQAPARRDFGLVVALCVGVLIGALGTMVLMVGGPEAPSPSRAAMELDTRCPKIFSSFDGCGECHSPTPGCATFQAYYCV